jgi:CheY-like chemotaxis protein
MDIRMPKMSGTEAAHAIRELGDPAAALPIIALTADISLADAQGGPAHIPPEYVGKFDGVLPKPIQPDLLADAISAYTGAGLRLGKVTGANDRFNPAQLTELIETLGRQTAEELIEDFAGEMQSIASNLRSAAAAGNTSEVRARAQNLAGGAASLGFVALAHAARHLNDVARRDDIDAVTPELAKVNAAITEAEHIVARLKSA